MDGTGSTEFVQEGWRRTSTAKTLENKPLNRSACAAFPSSNFTMHGLNTREILLYRQYPLTIGFGFRSRASVLERRISETYTPDPNQFPRPPQHPPHLLGTMGGGGHQPLPPTPKPQVVENHRISAEQGLPFWVVFIYLRVHRIRIFGEHGPAFFEPSRSFHTLDSGL